MTGRTSTAAHSTNITGHDWMEMENYDICINTGAVDYEKTVEIIEFYVHSMLGLQ